MGNMYGDSILQVNAIVGCEFHCNYCEASFQRQMKRQKQNCLQCYNYEVHEHLERLDRSYPNTEGDQFIWLCSSCDISFGKKEWIERVLSTIRENSNKTFFLQSKEPTIFLGYKLPHNLIIGTTIETNLDNLYLQHNISKAPLPTERAAHFRLIDHPRKSITIEPILNFELNTFVRLLKQIAPERIYIGYDTKNTSLPEPSLSKTKSFMNRLRKDLPMCKIKKKYFPKSQNYKIEQWTGGYSKK
jgi:DNA repair photolyase